MSSSNDGAPRGLRDSWWGKVLLLGGILLAAVLVARSCGSRETEVSRDEAVEIARAEVDFEADDVQTRFVPRGVQSRPAWAVSFRTTGSDGAFERIMVVVVDARDGRILEVRERG